MKPFNWIYAAWIPVMLAGLAEVFAASPKVAKHQLDPARQAKVEATYGQVPLAFEANQGQADKKVRFLSRGSAYSLSLSTTEAVFQWQHGGFRKEKPATSLARARRSESIPRTQN